MIRVTISFTKTDDFQVDAIILFSAVPMVGDLIAIYENINIVDGYGLTVDQANDEIQGDWIVSSRTFFLDGERDEEIWINVKPAQ